MTSGLTTGQNSVYGDRILRVVHAARRYIMQMQYDGTTTGVSYGTYTATAVTSTSACISTTASTDILPPPINDIFLVLAVVHNIRVLGAVDVQNALLHGCSNSVCTVCGCVGVCVAVHTPNRISPCLSLTGRSGERQFHLSAVIHREIAGVAFCLIGEQPAAS